MIYPTCPSLPVPPYTCPTLPAPLCPHPICLSHPVCLLHHACLLHPVCPQSACPQSACLPHPACLPGSLSACQFLLRCETHPYGLVQYYFRNMCQRLIWTTTSSTCVTDFDIDYHFINMCHRSSYPWTSISSICVRLSYGLVFQ